MRRFLTDILLFCGLLLSLLLAADLAYNLKLRSLRIDPAISTLICGDSHAQSDLNDGIIPRAVNIAQSSEHLLYTHQKLKLILPRNASIRTVILSLSFHSFSSFYDRLILKSHFTDQMYPQYFLMMDWQRRWFLLCHDPAGMARALPGIIRELGALARARRYSDYSFWGYYYHSDHSNLNEGMVTEAIRRHYYQGNELQGFARYQEPYLERIVRLCADQHVRLILVNTPVSPQYAARVPQKFIDHYDAVVAALAGKEGRLLDYHDLNLPAQWYGDGDHLNARGAAFFSGKVAADIAP